MAHFLLVLLVLLSSAPPSRATIANDVCPAASNPCVVPQGTTILVSTGSILDFGARALVLSSGSGTRLDAGTGSMTILAGSLTLNPGSALLARHGEITVTTSGDIAVLRAGTARARIDVSDFVSPGSITLTAGGNIQAQGTLTAQGSGAESNGGLVKLMAMGDVILSGDVIASAGGNGIGGDVSIQAPLGDLLLSAPLDVSGGIGGGTIDAVVGGSISTVAVNGAQINAKADGAEGDGGTVDLIATGGDVIINVPIWAQASPGVDFGGSGGDVTIEAVSGTVVIADDVDLSGAVPDGDGGDFDVTAGLDLTQTGVVSTLGRDQTGVGGSVDLFAERALRLGPIDASGTCLSCAGGDINAIGWCSVVVPTGALVKANGGGGGVLVRSGDALEVHGRVEAGTVIGLLYRRPENPPDLSGAVFVPAPTVQAMPSLIPCGGPIGASCGNGAVELGETCDDGNKASCDGCSSSCQVERCGDGRLGCDQQHRAEACDDGNLANCDGCASDCTRRDRVCGDGTTECGEQCDTGSTLDCDAGMCSAQCVDEGCGNGRVECTEQCDDGGPSPECSDSCVLLTPPLCGDGTEDPGEGCDDGNVADCDGCSRLCQVEGCGNGMVECSDECDDFNTTPCDGCSNLCHLETCGNQIVDCGEECDDGDENGKPGSNCLACRIAPVCTPETIGACIPCLQPVDCDPLGRCGGTDCVDDVCIPDPIDCTSDDPCEVGSCHVSNGCEFAPVLEFGSVRCRLGDLAGVLASDGVSEKARTKLGKLLAKAGGKVDAAEVALEDGKPKRVGRSLRGAGSRMVRFGKKVVKLQLSQQITDPDVGAALSERSGNAVGRIEGLRGDLGV